MVRPSRPLFVLFGSSIVQFSYTEDGWGATLADIYSRKTYCFEDIVVGIQGVLSKLSIKFFQKCDASVQPSLVIVYFGGNDSMAPHSSGLGPHVPLPEYVENMRKIIIHLKSLSDKTRIIFLGCPPVNVEMIHNRALSDLISPLDRTNEACKRYSEAGLEICREIDVKAIDLWSAIYKRDDWMTACFTDGIHLSSEGSKLLWKRY